MLGSQLQRPHSSTEWVGEDSRACYTHANGTCVVVADESDCGLVREAHDGRLRPAMEPQSTEKVENNADLFSSPQKASSSISLVPLTINK